MDFFKQAASFAGGNKKDGTSSTDGGFDVNSVSDMMSKAEGFLSEKKKPVVEEEDTPVVKTPEPVHAEEDEPEKPSLDDEEITKPAVEKVRTEEEGSEKIPTLTDSAEAVEPKVTPTGSSHVAAPQTSEVASEVDGKPSYSELYGSAQTLYSGLQGKLGGKATVDDKELATAAEDLLQGAEQAGLLKPDSQYSDYFKKAGSYLHNYSSETKKPSSDESA